MLSLKLGREESSGKKNITVCDSTEMPCQGWRLTNADCFQGSVSLMFDITAPLNMIDHGNVDDILFRQKREMWM